MPLVTLEYTRWHEARLPIQSLHPLTQHEVHCDAFEVPSFTFALFKG